MIKLLQHAVHTVFTSHITFNSTSVPTTSQKPSFSRSPKISMPKLMGTEIHKCNSVFYQDVSVNLIFLKEIYLLDFHDMMVFFFFFPVSFTGLTFSTSSLNTGIVWVLELCLFLSLFSLSAKLISSRSKV